MIDHEARRMVSELGALVESEGRATRAAVEAVMAYLRAHEADRRAFVDCIRIALEDLDTTAARLSSAQARTERHLAENDRRDAEIATSVSRIATTGGATGGLIGAIIAAILSALQGCGPTLAPAPTGHHGTGGYYSTPVGGTR